MLALVARAPLTAASGAIATILFTRYILRAAASHDGFERAFGSGWQDRIHTERLARVLKRRWSPRLPRVPNPRCERDVVFATIPGSDRQLLCDVWQPTVGMAPSGLALIYFHGGGWHFTDKDYGTRPFFRHLTAQGHVAMDAANCLCPEVSVRGQVHDVKRAVA
jgi:acetyl esterase/lipase